MKIIKNKDHVLFNNHDGEYHMSLDQFNILGREKAKEYALQEINLKKESSYRDTDIDFKRARKLGFCEYGIEDFCKKLDLDIKNTYTIKDLCLRLTKQAFLSYPLECLKLFGKSVFDNFGGPKQFLSEERTRKALNLILNSVLPEKEMHKLACKCALRCINNYEKTYPNDDRPRKAIEAKLLWIDGKITDEELSAAWSASWSAASSAASSAAWSAESAAWSAAWSAESAAWSAESAARSAAWSAGLAAESAELEWQIEQVLGFLNE